MTFIKDVRRTNKTRSQERIDRVVVNYCWRGAALFGPVLWTGIDERALSPAFITTCINAPLPTGDPKTLAVCEF